MAIQIPQGFKINSRQPVDDRLTLTKAQMVAVSDVRMPDRYFALCSEDNKLYIYDKSRTPNSETGKFYLATDDGKLDVMPGDSYTSGNAYNLPYYFYTVPSATKVSVHTKTVTLDGNKIQGDYSLDVNSATSDVAGLMTADDKNKLDGINTLTEAEIKAICK